MKQIEITKEQVEDLFKGTNFGPRGETHEERIALMVDCVFKGFAGYSSGSTIEGICAEAGLLSVRNNPTRAGARWAYHQVFSLRNVEAWQPLPGAPLRFRLRFVTTLRLELGAGSGLPSAGLFSLRFWYG